MKRLLPRLLALLHLLLVAGAMLIFALVGERSARVAFFVYLPRALFLLPSLAIVPLLICSGARGWLWLQGATVVLVLGPLMGLHLGHPREGQRALRVLSWQVWYGAGEASALAREVAAAQPDVVMFEAAGHRADVVLQDGRFPHYLHEDQYVIASRWPVRVAAEGEWVSNAVHRPWVRFEVQTPFGAVQAVAVHVRSVRGTLELRHGGWRRTLMHGQSYAGDLELLDAHLGALDEELRRAGPLAFAAGDFNAGDGGAVLRGRFGGLTDAWASTNFGWGFTFPSNGRGVPWLRLDHFFAAEGLVPLRARVLGGRGSDHAGLLVDLMVRQAP